METESHLLSSLSLSSLSLSSLTLSSLTLSREQIQVITDLQDNKNVCLTAPQGTGKSFLIKKIKDLIPDKRTSITASTGIAAFNIGGITIHSFLGIGIAKNEKEKLLQKVKKNNVALSNITLTDLLIIDEISMISSELFETIEFILRKIRSSELFAGGVQLLLVGDFGQLEPINGSLLTNEQLQSMGMTCRTLVKNYRQENDTNYGELLHALRIGNLTKQQKQTLRSRITTDECNDCIHIFPTNQQVTNFNRIKMQSYETEKEYVYKIKSNCSKTNLILQETLTQFKSRDMYELKLRKGYRVMLLRNINQAFGLVNGLCGYILKCTSEGPQVKFDNGIIQNMKYVKWTDSDNKEYVSQIPLMVAFASTIHKTQGLTINKAKIDINKCFCNNQMYVALSRVKCLNDLYLYPSN